MKSGLLVCLLVLSWSRKIVFEKAQENQIQNIDYVEGVLRTGILGYIGMQGPEKYMTVNLNQKSVEVLDQERDTVIEYYLDQIENVNLEWQGQKGESCFRVDQIDHQYYVLCFNDKVMMKEWLQTMYDMKTKLDQQQKLVSIENQQSQQDTLQQGQIRFMKQKLDQIENKEQKLEQLMQSEQKEMQINELIGDKSTDSLGLDQLDRDLGIILDKKKQIRFHQTSSINNRQINPVHKRHRLKSKRHHLHSHRNLNKNIQKMVQDALVKRLAKIKSIAKRQQKLRRMKTIPRRKQKLRRIKGVARKRQNKKSRKMQKARRMKMQRQNLQRMKQKLANKMDKRMKAQIKKKLVNKMMLNQFRKQIQKKLRQQFNMKMKRMKKKIMKQVQQNFKRKVQMQNLNDKMRLNRQERQKLDVSEKKEPQQLIRNAKVTETDKYIMFEHVDQKQQKKDQLDKEMKQYQQKYNELMKEWGQKNVGLVQKQQNGDGQIRFRKRNRNRKNQLSRSLDSYEKEKLADRLQKSESGIMRQMGDIMKSHKNMKLNRRRFESQNMSQNNEMGMGYHDNRHLKKYQQDLEEGLQIFKKRLHNNLNRMQTRLKKHQ